MSGVEWWGPERIVVIVSKKGFCASVVVCRSTSGD